MFKPHHVALSISNINISTAFYSKLGFHVAHRWVADDDSLSITHLVNDGFIIELFCYREPSPAPETIFQTATDLPVIGTKHFGFRVDSIEDARQLLIDEGLMDDSTGIINGKTNVKYFFIKDPDGILVEIVEDKRGY